MHIIVYYELWQMACQWVSLLGRWATWAAWTARRRAPPRGRRITEGLATTAAPPRAPRAPRAARRRLPRRTITASLASGATHPGVRSPRIHVIFPGLTTTLHIPPNTAILLHLLIYNGLLTPIPLVCSVTPVRGFLQASLSAVSQSIA